MLGTLPNLWDRVEFQFSYLMACKTLVFRQGLSVPHNLAHCLKDGKPQTNVVSLLDTKDENKESAKM